MDTSCTLKIEGLVPVLKLVRGNLIRIHTFGTRPSVSTYVWPSAGLPDPLLRSGPAHPSYLNSTSDKFSQNPARTTHRSVRPQAKRTTAREEEAGGR
jgi:hypothetical protein